MGVVVGIFFLDIIGAEKAGGNFYLLGHSKMVKTLVPAKVKFCSHIGHSNSMQFNSKDNFYRPGNLELPSPNVLFVTYISNICNTRLPIHQPFTFGHRLRIQIL